MSWLVRRFNGATRIHAWRLVETEIYAVFMSLLQWGHAHSRVETDRIPLVLVQASGASMGPRAFTRGDVRIPQAPLTRVAASMGPRAFTRGDARDRMGLDEADVASMGPRAFTRGDLKIDSRGI